MLLVTFGNLLLFLIIFFLIFYVNGFGIISIVKDETNDYEKITLSLALSIVLFVLIASLAGIVNLRFLVLPVIVVLSVINIVRFRTKLLSPWITFFRSKYLLFLIFLGILIQGFINFPSGYNYPEGLLFWSSQGHDGIWHVSVMEEIKKNFPPNNPLFSGDQLYNYHYLVDVLMGEFARLFPFFSSLDLYFRFFPIIFSMFMGLSVFTFTSRWKNSESVGYWAIFFTYFVGSFGYIVTWIKNGKILGGETVFWASQLNTVLGNPPHAISICLLSTFFLSLLFFTKSMNQSKGKMLKWGVITFIIGSVLAGFKVSGGVVLLGGLGFALICEIIFLRNFKLLPLLGALSVSNFLIFKSLTRGAESFLMFLPWWFVRTMIVDGGRVGWIDIELRRQTYLSKGTWHADLRVLQLELFALFLFVFGNLGTRFLALYDIGLQFIKQKRSLFKDRITLTLFGSMATGFIVPMLFVQKGIIYNNIQFMQYFLLITGFFAASTMAAVFSRIHNKVIKTAIFILLFVFSAPTVIGNLVEFYGPGTTPLAVITTPELDALSYLRDHSQPEDVILNLYFNGNLRYKFTDQPRPIYAWYSTGYITALTARPTFLSSEEQVMITGYPFEQRRDQVKKFFSQKDIAWNKKFLDDNAIKFIYLPKQEPETPFDPEKDNLRLLYNNSEVNIYAVQ